MAGYYLSPFTLVLPKARDTTDNSWWTSRPFRISYIVSRIKSGAKTPTGEKRESGDPKGIKIMIFGP